MKLAYPASHNQSRLNDTLLALKIARHSPCSACKSCSGLHPSPAVDVRLDEQFHDSSLGDLGQYGSDDDEVPTSYLDTCACGHNVEQHHANYSELGRSEFDRRGRVAIRLDELLQDSGRLLDFDYDDDDINSLRRQMTQHVSKLTLNQSPERRYQSIPESPDSSVLSDPPVPLSKKRRISSSSLSAAANSEDEDDDDDDEQPLAARMAASSSIVRPDKSRPGRRSGKTGKSKKGPGKKTKKAHTAPTSLAPPEGEEQAQMNGKLNGANGHELKVKVEDKMDEDQLTRLAAGVTVDSAVGRSSAGPPVRTEKAGPAELKRGVIQITPVENDGEPRSLVILTGLKTLFQKQLPKMPREYIARLVYDSNSKSLAIVKQGYKVVGGICYRPFAHRGFAEIVFFATNSVYQEKGYGGMLMDHFKAHIKKTYPDMLYFLTYADNYAVGYFEKQGFSKDITLDRSKWAGYIKDYEGGTIMQCTMLRKVDYLEKAKIISQQQDAIMTKIREMSKSHIIHPGLPQFHPGAPEDIVVDYRDVPGLKESGWTPDMANGIVRPQNKNSDQLIMEDVLTDLKGHSQAWPFQEPVNTVEVSDYLDVVKQPMDLSTMQHKVDTKQYGSLDEFAADAQLIFDNARLYNPESSIYAKNATTLEKYFVELLGKAKE